MTRAKFIQVVTLLLMSSIVSASGYKQSSPTMQVGRLVGTVTDMNAARVPKAKVIIDGAGTSRAVSTGEDGTYQSELPPGIYRIRVESLGFCPVRRASFRMQAATTTVLNFTLIACPLANQLAIKDGQYKGEVTRYLDPFREESIPIVSTGDTPLELLIRYGKRREGANFVEYKGAAVSYDEYAPNPAGSVRRRKYQGVTVTYNTLTIYADKVCLDQQNLRLEASGNVVVEDGTRQVQGGRAVVDLKTSEPNVELIP
jgi:hypothetical protein